MVKEVTETIRCDICGVDPAERLCFAYEREMDAAGSMEDIFYDIDLCDLHWYEVHLLLVNYEQQPTRVSSRTMTRSSRWDLKQKIVGIRRAWRKMSADEQGLIKQILRLGVNE